MQIEELCTDPSDTQNALVLATEVQLGLTTMILPSQVITEIAPVTAISP